MATERIDVGFLGLGIMGSRMAANLVAAGHRVTVWNRTAARARDFGERTGAAIAGTPAEAAGGDMVITMLVDGPQVEAVLLGPDGVATAARPGLLCVDMSTIGPRWARSLAEALSQRGLQFVDAPVTGSAPRAETGTLTIMAGGSDEDLARAAPAFDAMGELLVRCGPVGQGQMVKVISNAVAAANAATLAEALIVARATGADPEALVDVLRTGAGGSTMVDLKAGPMREHDFTPLFRLDHMLKDVRMCLEEGEAAGVPFESAARVRELLAAGTGRGHGERDFIAILEVLEGLAGTRL